MARVPICQSIYLIVALRIFFLHFSSVLISGGKIVLEQYVQFSITT